MIEKLYIYEGTSFDPHYNLAVEEVLLNAVPKGGCILYLWQNRSTVVIGKNQNAFRECRTSLLEEEGGTLARRLSGGGAVYHDLGNLNFTFLMEKDDYDLDRQNEVILAACRNLGIAAEKSGRNDMLIDGRKFSGSAYYHGARTAYHHGTLMIDVDPEKLGRYLSPSKAKLEAKGVQSVRSRVTNLKEHGENVTLESVIGALKASFAEVYGHAALPFPEPDATAVEQLRQRNASWEWNYGSKPLCTAQVEGRFPWGGVELLLTVTEGRIQNIKVYSDAMDETLPQRLESALQGKRLTAGELDGIQLEEPTKADILSLLKQVL